MNEKTILVSLTSALSASCLSVTVPGSLAEAQSCDGNSYQLWNPIECPADSTEALQQTHMTCLLDNEKIAIQHQI